MSDLLVRDLMHLGVVTCDVQTPVNVIAQMMVDNVVHCIVVVDEAGEACGVISDLGLMKAYGKDAEKMTAEDILGGSPIIVNPDALVSEAVAIMQEKHIHHLVIMSEPPLRRPVGILAASDVIKEMAKRYGAK
ncbi:CBS domain-containing protein [Candidatus Oleimmundimicrobium sp.]|uniref:CBS domain-containing protein n=1 Tax=Candidatus Oleimmundimicrobium sp. TaxID=3060597 RepID=UPI00271E6491|nr:CBS domain-containing protein [Candidatus Oleimmundimicrobium sp.]MDO8885682.1 CBS domain-containing protein [Candidatus Oleimmundimicrobium sp.]